MPQQQPGQANITVPAVLIKIEKEWHEQLTPDQLYERTRRYWCCNPRRKRIPPQYGLSVARGIIREVFEIDGWEDYDMSLVTIDPTRVVQQRSEADQNGQVRKGFIGIVTRNRPLHRALIGKSVRHLSGRGKQNLITYVNCDA